jgi:hypothetical protein
MFLYESFSSCSFSLLETINITRLKVTNNIEKNIDIEFISLKKIDIKKINIADLINTFLLNTAIIENE